jgi:hypothetical protein
LIIDFYALVLFTCFRETAAEILFQDGEYLCHPSLPQAILQCVSKVGIDLRLGLLSNMLVVGGMARMPVINR